MNSSDHQLSRLAKLAAVLAITFIAARAVAASPFQDGDILYTDSSAAVIGINPATGQRTIVASGGRLLRPFGIALDANGDVLVSDTGSQAIIRIDSLTGSQTAVAVGGLIATPFGPYGIAVERKGDILVANGQAMIRVNPLTGEQALVSAGGRFGASGGAPVGLAATENGELIVAVVGSPSEVVRVNPKNGRQTLLSRGGYLKVPQALAVSGSDIYVTDVATSDGNFGIGSVIHIDLRTKLQTVVSSGGNLVGPVGIAIDENGQLVVGDPYTINPDSSERYDGGIIKIDPRGGNQTLIARGQDSYVNPRGIAVVQAVRPVGR